LLAGNLGLSYEPSAFVQCLLQQLIDLPELAICSSSSYWRLTFHLPAQRSGPAQRGVRRPGRFTGAREPPSL